MKVRCQRLPKERASTMVKYLTQNSPITPCYDLSTVRASSPPRLTDPLSMAAGGNIDNWFVGNGPVRYNEKIKVLNCSTLSLSHITTLIKSKQHVTVPSTILILELGWARGQSSSFLKQFCSK